MEKPILFNTEMVKAILENRKTNTRRVIKKKHDNTHLEIFNNKYGTRLVEIQNNIEGETWGKNDDGSTWQKLLAMIETEREHKPCDVGDILYVRETWQEWTGGYAYKVGGDYPQSFIDKWRPSIHMPKEAARIFLKVISVRVERIQDITEDGAKSEGAKMKIRYQPYRTKNKGQQKYVGDILHQKNNYRTGFAQIWDNTLDINDKLAWQYTFESNPWVWVIEFERIER